MKLTNTSKIFNCKYFEEGGDFVPAPFGTGAIWAPAAECEIESESTDCTLLCPDYEEKKTKQCKHCKHENKLEFDGFRACSFKKICLAHITGDKVMCKPKWYIRIWNFIMRKT